MKTFSNLIEVLISNSWQENLNTWKFHGNFIEIKNYAKPDLTISMAYSIEEITEDKFILKTNNTHFGNLLLTLIDEGPLPKLLLRSEQNSSRSHYLQAFNGLSVDQKLIIEDLLIGLKKAFEIKQNEVSDKMLRLKKGSDSNEHVDSKAYRASLEKVQEKIQMLEKVIYATIHVATNFEAYQQNINADVTSLQEEINIISVNFSSR